MTPSPNPPPQPPPPCCHFFERIPYEKKSKKKKKNPQNVSPLLFGMSRRGCWDATPVTVHQTFAATPPRVLRRAAKVKVFKGREAGEEDEEEEERWLTREGQEESYLSSTSCTTLGDAEAAYALWEICPSTSVQISRRRDSSGGAAQQQPLLNRLVSTSEDAGPLTWRQLFLKAPYMQIV